MAMRLYFTVVLMLFVLSANINAQIKGVITDISGEPLPFASVYVRGTSTGTNSNAEGQYQLDIPEGVSEIAFQYVGYETKVSKVEYVGELIELDVQLAEQSIALSEVEVTANAEDPAYPIIRKAIEKRKYYRDLVDSYSTHAYVKGMQKLEETPEKIMGMELGNLGGILDSNRQGIIYLSESESMLHVQKPNKQKEVMISSKFSGNDNGFSFNRASFIDFNFYDNHLQIRRNIISPIAGSALSYYRYKLIGTFFDDGRLINKIKVIPKQKEGPILAGYIYIVEDLWNIHSAELFLTGLNIQLPLLDTMEIKQVNVPVDQPDKWMILSQTLDLSFKLMGFKVNGYFTGVFSDYELNPAFEEGFFTNEIFKVEEGANEKDLKYWDTIRPVPLTLEEEKDYVRKDTLQKIWNSKEFQDSIDRKFNKFKFFNILTGYSYQKSYNRLYFDIESPLNTIQFNAVQGWLGSLNMTLRKELDENAIRWYTIEPSIMYSFADEEIRGGLNLTYNFDSRKFSQLEIGAGRETAQFNSENPISPLLNEMYSLWDKRNFMRIYDKYYGRVGFNQELVNGLYFKGSIEYADRSFLNNQTNYSFSREEELYYSNDPVDPVRAPVSDQPKSFDRHQALLLDLALRIRINQKYMSLPDQKFILGSKFPDLWIRYRKGIAAFGSDVNFDQISASLEEDFTFGLVGESEFFVEGGVFINTASTRFMDFTHFNGNRTIIGNPNNYLQSFLLMPYYDYSTTNGYFQGHYQHHFKGFLLDKVPLIRKLKWNMVVGASLLYTEDQQDYLEVNVGIDNIGIGIVRLFRVDIVNSFVRGKYQQTGVVVGIKL